ncbi:MAG: DNA (cytosine-5-)-methyltransferase [Ktedonobacteraceae bacterium]
MTVGSLFAGIGGFDLGMERSGGFEIAWQIEIDPFCQKVLAKHWPDVARYGDIRECGAHNLAPVDVLCGGFPCQPHSSAGKRQASKDDRDLWPEFARLIRELTPQWVLAENVVGLLSSEGGCFFGTVLRDLAQAGYDAEWCVLSAARLGAPHLRERVFIVAYPFNTRCTTTRDISTRPIFQWSQSRWKQGTNRVGRPSESWGDFWAVESDVCRVAHGVSSRLDRIRGLGNAIVPQCAEYVARCILAHEIDRGM